MEKAFHQIEIRKSDRDKLCFLWVQNPDNNNPSIVQLRFSRLPFGLKPSPSILGGTIRKHLTAYEGEYEGEYESGKYQEVVKILSDLYVDDLYPVHTGTISYRSTSVRSKKWYGEVLRSDGYGKKSSGPFQNRSRNWAVRKSEPEIGTIRYRTVPFSCEQKLYDIVPLSGPVWYLRVTPS